MGESLVDSWIGKIRWRWDRLPALVFLDFPCDSAGKESACDVGDLCSIPGLRRSPGEGIKPTPLAVEAWSLNHRAAREVPDHPYTSLCRTIRENK